MGYVFDPFGTGSCRNFFPDVIIDGQVLENADPSLESGMVALFASLAREKLDSANFIRA